MMRKEQATMEMQLNQFETGAMQRSQKRYVQRDARLTILFERFQNEECNLAEYLAAVRHQSELNNSE